MTYLLLILSYSPYYSQNYVQHSAGLMPEMFQLFCWFNVCLELALVLCILGNVIFTLYSKIMLGKLTVRLH